MHGKLRFALCTLLYASTHAHAATVFRCEDSRGNITFTLQGCPSDHQLQLQSANNPTPGSGKPIPLAKTNKRRQAKSTRQDKDQDTLVIVGEHQDGCGNQITGSLRRTAIISQQARSGMTQKDVESALGKPDKISSQNGQTRYTYRDNEGNSKQVSFDENGCVRGKR